MASKLKRGKDIYSGAVNIMQEASMISTCCDTKRVVQSMDVSFVESTDDPVAKPDHAHIDLRTNHATVDAGGNRHACSMKWAFKIHAQYL